MGRVSCAARLKGAPAFHAIESALPGGVVCPGFFSIALMRPPLERLVSHSMELARWGMVVPGNRTIYRTNHSLPCVPGEVEVQVEALCSPWWRCKRRCAPLAEGTCRNYSHLRALAPPVYDNYYVRMLLGEQGIAAPVGSLTRAHLARAKRVLSTLDLILDSNEPRTPLALQYATGIGNFTSCRAPTRVRPSLSCAMSVEDSARAARDNALDLEVYAFAKHLSEGHVTKILRRAAHLTMSR